MADQDISMTGAVTDRPAVTGTTQLPAARVKRIIKEDREIAVCSAEAVFLISVATELFLQRVSKSALRYAHNEKRKTVAYKDVANVVADNEQLDFLADVVPQAISLAAAIKRRHELDQQHGSILAAFGPQTNGTNPS